MSPRKSLDVYKFLTNLTETDRSRIRRAKNTEEVYDIAKQTRLEFDEKQMKKDNEKLEKLLNMLRK